MFEREPRVEEGQRRSVSHITLAYTLTPTLTTDAYTANDVLFATTELLSNRGSQGGSAITGPALFHGGGKAIIESLTIIDEAKQAAPFNHQVSPTVGRTNRRNYRELSCEQTSVSADSSGLRSW